MNIAMEQTEEYVNGQLKAKYGDCFIRGNNGMWVVITVLFLHNQAHMLLFFSVLYISASRRKSS